MFAACVMAIIKLRLLRLCCWLFLIYGSDDLYTLLLRSTSTLYYNCQTDSNKIWINGLRTCAYILVWMKAIFNDFRTGSEFFGQKLLIIWCRLSNFK